MTKRLLIAALLAATFSAAQPIPSAEAGPFLERTKTRAKAVASKVAGAGWSVLRKVDCRLTGDRGFGC